MLSHLITFRFGCSGQRLIKHALHLPCVLSCRDIKGGNILIMPSGVLKLIDFGCAKRLYMVCLMFLTFRTICLSESILSAFLKDSSMLKCQCYYNLVLPTGLIMWIGHRKEIPKLTFRALALRQSKYHCQCFCWEIFSFSLDSLPKQQVRSTVVWMNE